MGGVSIRFFAGMLMNAEMKLHLSRSKAWKQACIVNAEQRDLIEVHYQGQDYIGRYFDQEMLHLAEIKVDDSFIRQSLSKYCPKYNLEAQPLHIFPQIFIA